MNNNKQYRFQFVLVAVAYLDGAVDMLYALKEEPVPRYTVCYIDQGKDIRIIFINVETKQDFSELPVVVIAKNPQVLEEMTNMDELSFGNKDNSN